MDKLSKLKILLKEKGASAALLTSNPSLIYFSGFTGGDAYLFITETAQYIITDSRYTIQAKNECKHFSVVNGSCVDFSLIKPLAEKEDIKYIAFEDTEMSVNCFNSLKNAFSKAEYIPLSDSIRVIRRNKSSEEIKKITDSLRLSEYALYKTVPQIKAGMSEVAVAAILESIMRSEGAEKTSFDTICASGIRSALPHGTASKKIIETGDFLTLDFGCILDGYCSDITRTFVIGKAKEKQRIIYETVLNAQLEAEKILKPEINAADADNAARQIITKAGFGLNFGHSLGHGVGLEIHELPNLSPKSQAVLSNGDIVTVEPGIYIENYGGVRIEDMVCITENKSEILTKYPKELTII